jgi:hypothetical protein
MALTNAALAHRALEYRRLRTAVKALELEAKAHSDAVVAELARRDQQSPFTHKGLRVTVKASTRIAYDVESLRDLVPADVFGRVTRLVVDGPALTTEIETGRVRAIDVGPASTETTGSPYIVVTGEAAA